MTCAQLGLRPGVLGQAYVLPFWDKKDRMYKAQFVAGYRGLVDLAYRSDRVLSIGARIVHANDYFEIEYNAIEDRLVHRPFLDGERGEARLYYVGSRSITYDSGLPLIKFKETDDKDYSPNALKEAIEKMSKGKKR